MIPALFVFPSLMLFVWLIYETAKLSQMKIRHQFAIDAASFIEMTNYSDFLNRSAYVNGAFPMRIFQEAFHDTDISCYSKTGCPGSGYTAYLDDILYQDGSFPRSLQESASQDPFHPPAETVTQYNSDPGQWDIGYGGWAQAKNVADPDIPGDTPDEYGSWLPQGSWDGAVVISRLQTVDKYWDINWDDATTIYKIYVQIYQLLGSVESAQFSVLRRLASGHNFLQKSYYMNTGGPAALNEGQELSSSFDVYASPFVGDVHFQCAPKIGYAGLSLTSSAWEPVTPKWGVVDAPNTIPDCTGLFQLVTVDPGILASLDDRVGGGWPVSLHWAAPKNYFNVPFNQIMGGGLGPSIHSTISLWTGERIWGGTGSNCGETSGSASVWPCPTPHFQVREYP